MASSLRITKIILNSNYCHMPNKYLFPLKILIVLLMVFILVGCSSKRFVNKALKYDEAGMFQEAAALYLRSLVSNSDNIDARMGLMRTGNLVLEEKLNKFSSSHRNSQHKEAVYAYLDAEKYYNNVASVGVKLDFPDQNKVYFNESKEEYLSQLYRESIKALNIDAFGTAEPLLAEVLSIDAAYKDSHEQWITAKYEPIYRNGLSYFENGLPRKAYYTFEKILKETGTYKESLSYKDQSLKNATITIVVLPFYVQENRNNLIASEVKAKTINEINQLKSPFYKLINDPVISSISDLKRIKEPQTALRLIKEAGLNISAQSVLYAKILKFTEQTTPLTKSQKPAYLKKVTEVTNEAGLTESLIDYSKTTYIEYYRQSKASITIEFTLMDIETGEIMVTDVFTLEDADKLNYAEYNGEYKQLIPGEWKKIESKEPTDKIYDDSRTISQLQQKFSAKKELREGHELSTQLIQNAALRIAEKIDLYNPEK